MKNQQKPPDKGMELALAMQAIAECEADFKEQTADYKKRHLALTNRMHMIRHEIITGQRSLLDPPPQQAA